MASRRLPSLSLALAAIGVITACADDPGPRGGDGLDSLDGVDGFDESEAGDSLDAGATTGDGDDGPSDLPGDDTSTGTTGDGDTGETGDGDTGETGEPSCDPSPASWDPWIGGPCVDDLDCGYEGGVCLREDEGYPCGTCSLPCELFCPDIGDAPETFCVAQDAVDPFAPLDGACLSKCDPSLLPDGGCRPGYSCALVDRHNEPGTKAAVCLPQELAPPKSECQQALDAAGLAWVPAHVPLDHPEGHPELDCVIDEPVRLYSPVNGVDYRYISFEEPTPMLVSCELALALDLFSELLKTKDAVEVAHIGTYNCRVISGTETLSEHSFAHAIDLGGFTLEGGEYFTVYDDWEDGVADPVTFAGQWLKELTDARFDMGIFNIILTPNYNDAHDDHFHVDLKPGSSFYE